MSPLTWLVVGTSPGSFGDHIARAVLDRGDKVIATARDVSKISSLKQAGAEVVKVDITAGQDALDRTAKEVLGLAGENGVDVLVNAAGTASMSTVEEMSQETLFRDFNANAFGAINLTRSFLPHFRAQKSGTFLFVTSSSGMNGYPGSSSYAGSKHAIEGMVDSLHQELSPFGVKCLVFEPGFARTPLIQNCQDSGSLISTSIEEYRPLVDYLSGMMQSMNGKQPGDPRKMAEVMVDLVKGTGVAEGKVVDPYEDWPLRLPLGKDAFDTAKKRAEGYLRVLGEWEEVIKGMDVVE